MTAQLEGTELCPSWGEFMQHSYHQMQEKIYMLDEIILARMMTALDLKFEKAVHYHNERYESNNNYEFVPQVTRPVCIYAVFTTEASFDTAEFTIAQPQSHPSLLDIPEAYHSKKWFASA